MGLDMRGGFHRSPPCLELLGVLLFTVKEWLIQKFHAYPFFFLSLDALAIHRGYKTKFFPKTRLTSAEAKSFLKSQFPWYLIPISVSKCLLKWNLACHELCFTFSRGMYIPPCHHLCSFSRTILIVKKWKSFHTGRWVKPGFHRELQVWTPRMPLEFLRWITTTWFPYSMKIFPLLKSCIKAGPK